jgi:2-polyprenyl-6-hydroxyphenyl methylase/3-demethylubiquinone-9 3-methyltransferase
VTVKPLEATNSEPAELLKFDRLAEQWWHEAGPLATLHAINPLRIGYIADRVRLDGASVLDVGCGAGILSEALAKRGAAVTGLDLADDNIRVARRHAADQGLDIDYRVASIEQLAAAGEGTFDIVTCLELLEHVPRPDSAIAACARAVRPGGRVFFSTINRNLKSFMLAIVGAEYLLGMVPKGTHEYLKLIKPSELARAARAAGLVIDDLAGLHFNPLTHAYHLGGNVDVNYLASATRPDAA